MESICTKLKAYLKGDFSSGMDDVIEHLAEICLDLNEDLGSMKSSHEKTILLKQHLEKAVELNSHVTLKLNEFSEGLEWMNVTEPLSLHRDLKGKIVLLDFFTYCCINCMHILPELKKLEQEFGVEDGLVVVGVHNAKFENEKVTANIESAVRRYNITHPVVNDSMEGMWTTLSVGCWPTLYLLGPEGEPLLSLQGEGHYETLRLFIRMALDYYIEKGQISVKSLPQLSAFKPPLKKTLLSYPGKVTVNPSSSAIAISDTANHRIIITSTDGEILHEVGGTEAGFADGDFITSRFNAPQGLAFYNDETLYVADSENHSIRQINLSEKEVSTVVGTGKQGNDYSGGKNGIYQDISSPWDVCLVGDVLFIAMAGTHQIWAYFIQDATLFGKNYIAGICCSAVGSGREENRNGSYPRSVGLAQPSALTYSQENESIYFADSESSAIRAINLKNGATSLLAGGDLNPKNLFAYGDVDGTGLSAKLQHPLGVAAHKSGVFVADSYNHKIKLILPSSKTCTTIDLPKNELNEPGGVFINGDKLFIADTNNHSIKIMSIPDKNISMLNIKLKTGARKPPSKFLDTFTVNVSTDNLLKLTLEIELPGKSEKDLSSPSVWALFYPDDKLYNEIELSSLSNQWEISNVKESGSAAIKARLFFCQGSTCTVREYAFKINIVKGASGDSICDSKFVYEDMKPL